MRWQDFDNPEEEKARLEKRIKDNPNDASACYELGTVYEYMQDWAMAKEFCDKAISLDPKNITYYAFSAFVNSYLEESEDAIDDLVTVIELGGDESDYYVELAIDVVFGMDTEYVFLTALDLRKVGKPAVADKLEKWLNERR